TEDGAIFRIRHGTVAAVANRLEATKINCLLPFNNSELWIGTNKGVLRWTGTELTRVGLPPALRNIEVMSLLRDRDANTWVGTSRGLWRLNANNVSAVDALESNGPVTALFEDREGNIWTGDNRGLGRLRDSAFISYPVPGLKSQSIGPLYIGSDDRIWFAPMDRGLRWFKNGKIGSVDVDGIDRDVVYSLSHGGNNSLWVGRQRGGLTHLAVVNGSFQARTYTQNDGLAQNSVYAVYESSDGTVWSGTLSGGVSEFRNGHFSRYTTANGLASNTVSSIAEGADGTMFFGTPNGVSAVGKRGWQTFGTLAGLMSPSVNCLVQDSSGVLWIGTAEGLAFLAAGKIRVPQAIPDALREPTMGIAEDRNGWLWIATANHVVKVRRSSLIKNTLSDVDVREFGLADGLLGMEGVKRYRSVVTDAKGQIWFSTNRGFSMVNPAREAVNSAPALVHIEGVSADSSPIGVKGSIQIPADKQRISFHYMALSLGNSERVRYRYHLDGFDRSWSEPTSEREASYANLGAGSYRFRVMASNSDGLWNGSESTVAFAVEPMLWQTWWFRLGCVACAGIIVLLVYRLRMHQLTRLLNVRFEERLAERTRIAQELHDTFLQGVVSVSMQLHVAVEQLPDNSPVRASLNRVLQLTGQVVEEGRNTLRGLRSSIESAHDLKNSFSRIPQELGRDETTDFRVVVEGVSLPLRAEIRDDVYGIGREALVNAFRHSGANNIAMHMQYASHELRITVQDNGAGIDSHFLRFGRDGHWGLSGMRERAERIGAKLRVLTRPGGGTEVELRVPSHIAWELPRRGFIAQWLTAFSRQQSIGLGSNRGVGK
ncbi:MAG TPA: two-component regulator propeller domain-containing protein, partial [Terriglobales bacterium]|nr:two-component regulator propeller domain-containing protein [Terriglobales bacterium]